MALRIHSTDTGEKREFVPETPGHVRMYVCGITSYAPSHIGHGRCYVAFDVIYRWLRRRWQVTYVRNFTDVEDKIIRAANERGEDPIVLSSRVIEQFHRDMAALGNLPPDHEPRVTNTMPEILALIGLLIERGHAYVADGDVYFEVKTFPAYGALSRRSQEDLEDLEAGARVEVDPKKRSPRDFALWKAAKPGEPSWDSAWGKGRPGWHIECSAMSKKYLGESFDLHGGGKDLVFPHHENEVAQSCGASGQPVLARFWLHNGFVNLIPEECPACHAALGSEDTTRCVSCGHVFTEAELKMSKSRGNFYPIQEVIASFEAEALRLYLLGSHYRSPIGFSHTRLAETERRLDKVYETLDGLDRILATTPEGPSGVVLRDVLGVDPKEAFAEAMDDDFNTAKAIGALSDLFKLGNDLVHGKEKERFGKGLSPADRRALAAQIRAVVDDSGDALGLWRQPPAEYLVRRRTKRAAERGIDLGEVDRIIAERSAARAAKDWKKSDQLRDRLKDQGVLVKDGKDGTSWELID